MEPIYPRFSFRPKARNAASIISCGNDFYCDEMERSIHDRSLSCVVKKVLESKRWCQGGGCVEAGSLHS